jgi:hypothetical protein
MADMGKYRIFRAGRAETGEAEIQNRDPGLPPGALAGVVAAEGIDEIAAELRLKPGDVRLDLACGRAWYGLEIAGRTGARLIGVDFSAGAVRQARPRADPALRSFHDEAFRSPATFTALRRVMAAATAP